MVHYHPYCHSGPSNSEGAPASEDGLAGAKSPLLNPAECRELDEVIAKQERILLPSYTAGNSVNNYSYPAHYYTSKAVRQRPISSICSFTSCM